MRPENLELSRRYADLLLVRGNAERTVDNYLYALKSFAQFLGERPIVSAGAEDIVARTTSPSAPATARQRLPRTIPRP